MSSANPSGYSGTPLIKKLGIKPGFRVALLHAPDGYAALLGDLPPDTSIDNALGDVGYHFVHAFYRWHAELELEFPRLKAAIRKDGMLWVSWIKKAARVRTDITEDVIRDLALSHGLVDVKVAAINARWSGLKLVYRVKDR